MWSTLGVRHLLPLLLTGCLIGPGQTRDRLDVDGDGSEWPADCDDADPTTHEGADELLDGVDNDCDGEVDEGADDTGTIPVGAPLVELGSTWSYLDDATPPTGWRNTDFDATSWESGPAELGYGDGDEVTELFLAPSPGQRLASVAFIREFTVDGSLPAGLVLDILCDDGALVMLNGEEILRTNLPAGTVTSDAYALADTEDALLRTAVEADALVEGRNTLAVSVHQSGRQSDDLSFDLALYLPE